MESRVFVLLEVNARIKNKINRREKKRTHTTLFESKCMDISIRIRRRRVYKIFRTLIYLLRKCKLFRMSIGIEYVYFVDMSWIEYINFNTSNIELQCLPYQKQC